MSQHLRELDQRSNSDVSVALLWRERDGRVLVAVRDSRNGESFELEVGEGERALDVFHHPYAYAAWHGIEPYPDDASETSCAA